MFEITIADDILIEPALTVGLQATANGYQPGAASLSVQDNDWPELTLEIEPSVFSEGAGPQAAMARLIRSPVTPRPVEIDLVNSNTNAVQVPRTVTIPGGEAQVRFAIAAVDNDTVDGEKQAYIDPWFKAHILGTRLGKGTTARVIVRDDDGPSLALTANRRIVAEGLSPAATLTLSRNTGTNTALVVQLTSDNTQELVLQPTVTLAEGVWSVNVPVTSVNDGVSDGNKTVTVTASAEGFTPASAQLIVTDVDMPDLVVRSVQAPPWAETESYIDIGYQIYNQGLANAASNSVVQRVYLSRDPLVGDDVLVGQFAFNGPLPTGAHFGQTIPVRLPQESGNYWVVVQTDSTDVIVETLEDNNSTVSPDPIRVVPAYTAVVSTSVDKALAGSPVPMTGKAIQTEGGPAQFALVSIHIRARDTVRTIAALTDAKGEFATTWQPLPGEAGYYEICAAHPGEPIPNPQDSFYLLGMKAIPSEPFVRIIAGDTATGSVNVENLSGLPLGGLAATVTDQPPNVQTTVTISTNVLAGNGTAKLEYGIAASDASYTSGLIRIVVTSDEGAALEVPLRVAITPRVPRLVAMPDRIEAGVQRGTQRTIPIKLVNAGGLNSGPITVSLPPVPWMSLATPNPMASLAPGETNTVLLQLMPGLDIQPGVHSGNLAVNTPNTGLGLPFSIRILSEATGALLVSTADEFTYYTAGSPPLTNATVRVLDAIDRTTLTNGVTDTQGKFFLPQLREGYYTVEIEAEKHDRYESTIMLEPGVTNTVDAFLPYQAVRCTWTVERIEIEDRYRITVETEFETVVPVPVITVDPPVLDLSDLKLVGQTRQVNMTFRNHGLIAANHLRLVIDKHAYYSIEPLITDLGTLPAKSSLTIPVMLRRIGPTPGLHAASKPQAPAVAACAIAAVALYDYLCADKNVGRQTPIPITGVDSECELPLKLPPIFTDTAPTAPSGPGGGGEFSSWTSVINAPSSIDINFPDLCVLLCWIKTIVGCSPLGCPLDLASCLVNRDAAECLEAVGGCISKLVSLGSCIKNIVNCARSTFGGGSAPPHSKAGLASSSTSDPGKFYLKGVWLMADLFNLITGSSDDVWLGPAYDPNASSWFDRFFAATDASSDQGRWITDSERANLLTGDLPTTVPAAELIRIIERWNRTMENVANGIYSPDDAPPGANLDFIDMLLVEQKLVELLEYYQAAQAAGYDDPIQALIENGKMALDEPGTAGVCARIKLRLDQQAVLSREAFRATLEINNETADPLDHIGVDLQITDSAHQPAESLFDIRPPELSNLNDVYGLGIINPGQKSTARWVIVPTVDAAPTNPTLYYIGGVFRYTLNGTEFVVPMVPVPITVNPTARLDLHYFHQRDVFSDDPFTDIVEPSVPFNLAVMVHNWGAGTARNFRITSAQPEIVDNEKGLLIDFKIIATEVAGQNMTPTLTADFGDIAPGQMKIARWLLTSTLQGLFINYSATFEHLDGRGNPRLSIIDKLDIHELIHLVQAGGAFEDGKPDFLVNDRPDSLDLPDTLWLSDGSSNAVAVVTNAVVTGTLSQANLQVQLSATMPPGWVYLRVPDPADGRYQLMDILRSDGVHVAIDTNAWVTDRTFLGMGKPPKREHVLHLLDHDSTGQYTLRYEPLPAPDTEPPTSMVDALPAQSRPAFLVRWSGQDNPGGTGISSYDVYYSENGGPFIRWLNATPNTSAVFQGAFANTYAFYSIAVDAAGNRQPTPAAPQAQTTVALENHPPVFAPQPNVVVNENDTVSIVVAATDTDGDTLTYKLGPGAPTGLNLNSVSGSLIWVTGEAHGPSTNTITIIAQDSGIPAMTATQQFNVVVLEVNSPPTLQPIPDQRIYEGSLLSINCVASDSDLPQQKVYFALVTGAPPGAAIDPNTGVFTWRPTEFQGGTNYQILVVVSDDWTPPLTATQAFNVVVLDNMPDFRLSIGTAAVLPGENGTVPLILKSGAELKQVELQMSIDGDRLSQLLLTNLAPQVGSATLLPLPASQFLLQFAALANSAFQGQLTLGQIGFSAAPDP
ncbi:MAG TPA: CARDB domain-containing protein, partial [Verrucomicrobiota bacterium]|nr:CARDB domain-containing protein [Verrucomicrobiota bacterium]